MDEHKFRDLYRAAVQVGESNSRLVAVYANEIRNLRKAIWQAIGLLRKGKIDDARRTLEHQIHNKDQ
jgi:hypothetical protein